MNMTKERDDIKIRMATAKDISRIRDIYNEAIRGRTATCDEDEKSLCDREEWFAQFNSSYPIFALCVGEVVAGYGCLFRYSPKSGYRFAVENSVYVAGEFRGHGYGRKILTHLISAARTCGYKYVEARVFEHNPTSLRLHESVGFKKVGVQERIANLDGRWFNNVILSLHID
jgi:L-amino acid N-acyltransferase